MKSYVNLLRPSFTGLIGLLLWVGPAGAQEPRAFRVNESAQEARSFRITDGEVYIDNRLVPRSELPASLEVDDVQMQYVFSGDVEPVIRVGETFFVLEKDQLREAAPQERHDVSVIFRDAGMNAPGGLDADFENDELGDISAFAAPHAVVLQRKAQELQEQAVRLQRLQPDGGQRFERRKMEELGRLARALTVQAEEAARMAEAMPRIQVEGYLNKIQQKNEGLFDRLVEEREMERETLRLAREIRSMDETGARREKIEALRSNLDEIFELKQKNRRQEIEELEARLEDLQEKLDERERLREDIVERRLRTLLHRGDGMKW